MKPEAKAKHSTNVTPPLLSLGVIFPKGLRQKMLKKKEQK